MVHCVYYMLITLLVAYCVKEC